MGSVFFTLGQGSKPFSQARLLFVARLSAGSPTFSLSSSSICGFLFLPGLCFCVFDSSPVARLPLPKLSMITKAIWSTVFPLGGGACAVGEAASSRNAPLAPRSAASDGTVLPEVVDVATPEVADVVAPEVAEVVAFEVADKVVPELADVVALQVADGDAHMAGSIGSHPCSDGHPRVAEGGVENS